MLGWLCATLLILDLTKGSHAARPKEFTAALRVACINTPTQMALYHHRKCYIRPIPFDDSVILSFSTQQPKCPVITLAGQTGYFPGVYTKKMIEMLCVYFSNILNFWTSVEQLASATDRYADFGIRMPDGSFKKLTVAFIIERVPFLPAVPGLSGRERGAAGCANNRITSVDHVATGYAGLLCQFDEPTKTGYYIPVQYKALQGAQALITKQTLQITNYTEANLVKCSKECYNNYFCHSFVHSKQESVCVLHYTDFEQPDSDFATAIGYNWYEEVDV